jgi:hypothetical protein
LATYRVGSFFFFRKYLPLKEHIIINHNKFSVITADGTWKDHTVHRLGGVSEDELLSPGLDHGLLGIKIGESDLLARAAKALEQDEDQSVTIYSDSKNLIRGIQEISTHYLKKIGVDKAAEVLREGTVRFGCPRLL